MKAGWVVALALLIGALSLGWIAWNQREQADEAREVAAALEVERDTLAAELARVDAQLDTMLQVMAEKEAERAQEQAEAEAREVVLSQRADSLTEAMLHHIPDDDVREIVALRVAELNQVHEERLAAKDHLLGLAEETIQALRDQAVLKERVNANLRQSLALAEEQRDAYRRAANPTWLEQVKQSAGLVGGALAIGYGVALLAGG
jgi:DNA helicase IV